MEAASVAPSSEMGASGVPTTAQCWRMNPSHLWELASSHFLGIHINSPLLLNNVFPFATFYESLKKKMGLVILYFFSREGTTDYTKSPKREPLLPAASTKSDLSRERSMFQHRQLQILIWSKSSCFALWTALPHLSLWAQPPFSGALKMQCSRIHQLSFPVGCTPHWPCSESASPALGSLP